MRTVLRCVLALGAVVALPSCASSQVTSSPHVRSGGAVGSIQVIDAVGEQRHALLISTGNTPTYGLNRLPAAWRSPRAAPAGSASRSFAGT